MAASHVPWYRTAISVIYAHHSDQCGPTPGQRAACGPLSVTFFQWLAEAFRKYLRCEIWWKTCGLHLSHWIAFAW